MKNIKNKTIIECDHKYFCKGIFAKNDTIFVILKPIVNAVKDGEAYHKEFTTKLYFDKAEFDKFVDNEIIYLKRNCFNDMIDFIDEDSGRDLNDIANDTAEILKFLKEAVDLIYVAAETFFPNWLYNSEDEKDTYKSKREFFNSFVEQIYTNDAFVKFFID